MKVVIHGSIERHIIQTEHTKSMFMFLLKFKNGIKVTQDGKEIFLPKKAIKQIDFYEREVTK